MFTQNTYMYVKHGKIYLATEYSREDRGAESNPYQLVASISKPLHPVKTSVTTYSSCSVQASILGFPGSSDCKESACNIREPGLIPGSGRFPWRRKWQPTPLFLPKESHGGRNWWVTVCGVTKSWISPSN